MRLKILYDGGPAYKARVVNADTGEVLSNQVVAVRWEIPTGDFHRLPECVLTLRAVPVELTSEATVMVFDG